MKSILIWGGVGLAIAGGLLLVFTFVDPQGNVGPGSTATLSVEVTEDDHRKGNLNADLVLLEYGDFQCPACRSFHPVVKKVEAEFGDRITIAFRQLPLRGLHVNAENAARASEAAAVQGKFWEMHDILFEKQDEWKGESNTEDKFVEYAVSLGLNPDQFREDYKSDVVADRVQEDLNAAIADNLNSTPTFFLGNELLVRPQGYDDFKNAILKALGEDTTEPESSDSESTEAEGS